jgi:hypothetical protein
VAEKGSSFLPFPQEAANGKDLFVKMSQCACPLLADRSAAIRPESPRDFEDRFQDRGLRERRSGFLSVRSLSTW